MKKAGSAKAKPALFVPGRQGCGAATAFQYVGRGTTSAFTSFAARQ